MYKAPLELIRIIDSMGLRANKSTDYTFNGTREVRGGVIIDVGSNPSLIVVIGLSLHKWERSFKNRNSLGSESGGSSLYEEIPYDILVPEDHEVLGPIIYRGQRCVVVEHDAEEDNGGQGDRH